VNINLVTRANELSLQYKAAHKSNWELSGRSGVLVATTAMDVAILLSHYAVMVGALDCISQWPCRCPPEENDDEQCQRCVAVQCLESLTNEMHLMTRGMKPNDTVPR
jgi:hypothetical protein